jgi:DMSO reductase anchor subunit/ferredoxin
LKGCPVDAYRKDALTGIVVHDAAMCIGCQYCTWNCPYGVPQFNEERGVVGKCDLCYGRLAEQREPACVNACPQGAIQVEIVNIADWRIKAADHGNAPGMPPVEPTLSTTRITLPVLGSQELRRADYHRVRPEHPHWPLILFLVLTQMSVGAYLLGTASPVSLALAHLGLAASLLHLGRPMFAFRAIKMWKRSWLSREVLAFSIFALLATAAIAMPGLAIAAGLAGLAGVFCSARIYMVPARPAWNSWRTAAEFYLTTLFLGAILAKSVKLAFAAAVLQALLQCARMVWLRTSAELELRQSGRLLRHDLYRLFLLRIALLIAAPWMPLPLAVAVGLAAELCGRYLFFVTVAPRNMAATFFGTAREAA